MNSVTWTMIELFVNVVEIIYILLIPTFQLGIKKNRNKWHIIAYAILFCICIYVYNDLTNNNVTSLLQSLLLSLIYSFTFIKGRITTKIFWTLITYSMLFFVDRLVIDCITQVYHVGLDSIAVEGKYRLIAMGIAKGLELFIVGLSYKYHIPVGKKSKWFIAPISISIVFPFILLLLGNHVWHIACVCIVLNMYYLIYMYQFDQIEQARRIRERLRLHENVATEHSLFKQFLESQQENVDRQIKDIWEEMKKDEVRFKGKIARKVYNLNLSLDRLYNTGDPQLDIVLSVKKTLAESKGIGLQTRIVQPLIDELDYALISDILAELIDNSIKAILKIPDSDDKEILLTLLRDEKTCVIEVENPINNLPVPPINSLLEDSNEGIGLKVIKNLVTQLDGMMDITHDNGFFKVHIEIPLYD